MQDKVAADVVRTLASVKKIPTEGISLESTLESLRIDSLDRITLLFELERVFNLNIPDESAQSLVTVADVVEGIRRLQSTAAGAAAAAAE